jgi:proliferating cell nuclear antigen PCNA
MELQCMDACHISLVAFSLPPSMFSELKLSADEKQSSIGVDVAYLFRILHLCGDNSSITFTAHKGGPLILTFDNQWQSISSSRFTIPDVEGENEFIGLMVPQTDYATTAVMASNQFKWLVTEMNKSADTVTIACAANQLVFTMLDDDEAVGTITKPASDDLRIVCKEEFEIRFSLRYLATFTKGAALSESVAISLHPVMPMKCSFTSEDGAVLSFYLAPKVVDDDEAKQEQA